MFIIGDFLPLVGGPEYCEYILDILEKLCTMQEVTVRDAVWLIETVYSKATKSILKLCDQLTPEEIGEFISAMAIRMHNGEWYTSKWARLVCLNVGFVCVLSYPFSTKQNWQQAILRRL